MRATTPNTRKYFQNDTTKAISARTKIDPALIELESLPPALLFSLDSLRFQISLSLT